VSRADLLVVEDDEDIGHQLVDALRTQGYRVSLASTARQALDRVAAEGRMDLILLDLGLPDLDGTALCRQLRSAVPDAVIVVLTARTEEIDVVLGLDAGADDYLTKPFRLLELLARIRAHLRRGTSTPQPPGPIDIGRLSVDPATRRAFVDGSEVPLRPKEFDLLAVLAQSAGLALSRDRLMSEVWDAHWFGSTKTLDMHISALRRKLAAAGLPGDIIATLRGHGYRLESGAGPRGG
jgi:DNA-binding response OmpR family regulator